MGRLIGILSFETLVLYAIFLDTFHKFLSCTWSLPSICSDSSAQECKKYIQPPAPKSKKSGVYPLEQLTTLMVTYAEEAASTAPCFKMIQDGNAWVTQSSPDFQKIQHRWSSNFTYATRCQHKCQKNAQGLNIDYAQEDSHIFYPSTKKQEHEVTYTTKISGNLDVAPLLFNTVFQTHEHLASNNKLTLKLPWVTGTIQLHKEDANNFSCTHTYTINKKNVKNQLC